MFQPFGQHTQSKSLDFGDGLISARTVDQSPRNFGHLRNPAAIHFLFYFNGKCKHLCQSFVAVYVCENPSVPVVICPRNASAAIMVSTLEMLRE